MPLLNKIDVGCTTTIIARCCAARVAADIGNYIDHCNFRDATIINAIPKHMSTRM